MYLTVQRAALRLGVAPHTVRRWTASGLLPCTRTPGGHRRIREEDVDALAQQIGGSSHMAARRAREREVDTLLETSLALVSRLELTELLKEIARQLTRLMDCHFCAVSSYDAEAGTVTMLADYDDSGRRLPDRGAYPLSRYPLTRRVLEEQVAAVVNVGDPAADPGEVRELIREGDRSLLMVPMVVGGRTIGLLELIDRLRERRFSRQDLRICSAVAGQAAVALNNAQVYAEARAATGDILALGSALQTAGDELAALGEAAGVDEVLASAARAAGVAFAASSCVVTAGGRSAGWSQDEAAAAGRRDRDGSGARRLRAVAGAEVLSVSDPSVPGGLRITLSLPRAARGGEPELLSLLAAVAGGHIVRLSGSSPGGAAGPR
jgi:excisionase family DNA binding protein